ncbi:MAG: hypothetical protein KAW47_11030 [Thermoplasmatales archaeon]|nr:hypothetical protein [Thermoplasmatales archaeon]
MSGVGLNIDPHRYVNNLRFGNTKAHNMKTGKHTKRERVLPSEHTIWEITRCTIWEISLGGVVFNEGAARRTVWETGRVRF